MKKSTFVNINDVEVVKAFVNDMSKFNKDLVSIDAVSGRYVICATSLLGLFSLDLSKQIQIEIESEDEALIDQVIEVAKNYA